METRDLIMFIFTFLVGIFAGGYVYFVGFVPTYVDTEKTGIEESLDFEIIGEVYGGCTRLGCDSFRLAEDRTFQYLPGANAIATASGRYPRQEFAALETSLSADRLAAAAVARPGQSCQSFVDGIDYRFNITLQSETYELDSCTTALLSDRELFNTLVKIFEVVADPSEFAFTWDDFQTAGVIGYIWPNLVK